MPERCRLWNGNTAKWQSETKTRQHTFNNSKNFTVNTCKTTRRRAMNSNETLLTNSNRSQLIKNPLKPKTNRAKTSSNKQRVLRIVQDFLVECDRTMLWTSRCCSRGRVTDRPPSVGRSSCSPPSPWCSREARHLVWQKRKVCKCFSEAQGHERK